MLRYVDYINSLDCTVDPIGISYLPLTGKGVEIGPLVKKLCLSDVSTPNTLVWSESMKPNWIRRDRTFRYVAKSTK